MRLQCNAIAMVRNAIALFGNPPLSSSVFPQAFWVRKGEKCKGEGRWVLARGLGATHYVIAMGCDCVRNAIALFGNPPPSTVCSRPRVRREESARRGGGEVVLPSWAGTTQEG